jgi:CRISPR-associated exonuclease Cas4
VPQRRITLFEEFKELRFKGTQVAYAIICERKLWLFSRGISMEHTSERVNLGKLLDETSFKDKEGFMDENVSIDFITSEEGIIVHEIKLSRAMEKAHILQVKYYLYYLKTKSVKISHGIIHYPRIKKLIKVELTEEDKENIKNILPKIRDILLLPKPPRIIRASYCSKCAYFELCYG